MSVINTSHTRLHNSFIFNFEQFLYRHSKISQESESKFKGGISLSPFYPSDSASAEAESAIGLIEDCHFGRNSHCIRQPLAVLPVRRLPYQGYVVCLEAVFRILLYISQIRLCIHSTVSLSRLFSSSRNAILSVSTVMLRASSFGIVLIIIISPLID